MKSYKFNVLADKMVGNANKKTIQYSARNIRLDDVKKVCDDLNEGIKADKNNDIKYVVRVQTIINDVFTVKSYGDENIRYSSMSDYLSGRVKDETKFEALNGFTVTMFKTPRRTDTMFKTPKNPTKKSRANKKL